MHFLLDLSEYIKSFIISQKSPILLSPFCWQTQNLGESAYSKRSQNPECTKSVSMRVSCSSKILWWPKFFLPIHFLFLSIAQRSLWLFNELTHFFWPISCIFICTGTCLVNLVKWLTTKNFTKFVNIVALELLPRYVHKKMYRFVFMFVFFIEEKAIFRINPTTISKYQHDRKKYTEASSAWQDRRCDHRTIASCLKINQHLFTQTLAS